MNVFYKCRVVQCSSILQCIQLQFVSGTLNQEHWHNIHRNFTIEEVLLSQTNTHNKWHNTHLNSPCTVYWAHCCCCDGIPAGGPRSCSSGPVHCHGGRSSFAAGAVAADCCDGPHDDGQGLLHHHLRLLHLLPLRRRLVPVPANNCYYCPDWANAATTAPHTDDSARSLLRRRPVCRLCRWARSARLRGPLPSRGLDWGGGGLSIDTHVAIHPQLHSKYARARLTHSNTQKTLARFDARAGTLWMNRMLRTSSACERVSVFV